MVSEFTGYVKDKKLPVGRNLSSIEAYTSIEDNGQLDTITIDDITKRKCMKLKSTQLLNNDEQQLKNPICDDIDEHEDNK